MNYLYSYVLCRTLRGDTDSARLDIMWKELQTQVDHVIDRSGQILYG